MVAGTGRGLNVSGLDRGDKSLEELEAEMSPAAIQMVDGMTDKIIKKDKRKTRHFYKRNRKAWDRMNRPHRLKKIELGMERTMNLIAGKGFITDVEIAAEGKAILDARDLEDD